MSTMNKELQSFHQSTEIEYFKNVVNEESKSICFEEQFILDNHIASEFFSDKKYLDEIFKHAKFESKTKLSAKDKKLVDIPSKVFEMLRNLNKLDLTGNMLLDLPRSILNLKNLEFLNISWNHFNQVPTVICELQGLKELIITRNKLNKLPSNLGDLKKLEKLDLSENELKYLPDSCSKMDNLKVLNISKNQYRKVPNCLVRGVVNLEALDVSMNTMMNLDNEICSTNIRKFHAREMFHKSLPMWIFSKSQCNMDIIECGNSRIQSMNCGNCVEKKIVEKLILRNCTLSSTQLEIILSQFRGVTCLNVGNTENNKQYANKFWDLPLQTLNTPETLNELNAEYTGISAIPKLIENFINLKIMNLSRNKINLLPEKISCLKNLETLIINENPLIMLPEDIGSMKSLTSLKLSFCSVKTLPASISELKNLKFLDLYSNDMSECPELKRLKNLCGMDLDQNYFPTDHIQVSSEISYEDLRKNIDDYDPKRITGTKFDYSQETSVSSLSSTSSEWNWADYSSSVSTENITENEEQREEEEEDWDVDHDFDPENPSIMCYPTRYFYYKKNPMYFCPADYHSPRVKDQIERERQCGYSPKMPPIVVGQFDDAEEDL